MGQKVIVTQDVLDMNPDLVEQGVVVGEEIELGPLTNEDGSPLTDKAESKANESTDILGGREKDDR